MRIIFYWDWLTGYLVPGLMAAGIIGLVIGVKVRSLWGRLVSFVAAAVLGTVAMSVNLARAFHFNWFYDVWQDILMGLFVALCVGLAVISGRLIRDKRRKEKPDDSCSPG